MCAISIERYSVIVHPFRSPITVSSCIITIFFIWVFAIILTLPYGIFMQVLNVVHILPSIKQLINHNETTNNEFELYNRTSATTSGVQLPKIDSKDREYLSVLLSQPKEMEVKSEYRSLFSAPKLYCDEMWPGDNLRIIYGITTTLIQFIIPFCIITFCYSKVCARLWTRVQTRPGYRNCSNQRKWLEKERAKKTNMMV